GLPNATSAAVPPTSGATSALRIAMDVNQRLGAVTLLTATSIVAALACTVLVVAWRQMHKQPAILWWAGSVLAHALASVLLLAVFGWAIAPLIIVGWALTTLGAAAGWLAARVFHSRSAPPQTLIVVLLAWLAGLLLPFPGGLLAAAFAFAL